MGVGFLSCVDSLGFSSITSRHRISHDTEFCFVVWLLACKTKYTPLQPINCLDPYIFECSRRADLSPHWHEVLVTVFEIHVIMVKWVSESPKLWPVLGLAFGNPFISSPKCETQCLAQTCHPCATCQWNPISSFVEVSETFRQTNTKSITLGGDNNAITQ